MQLKSYYQESETGLSITSGQASRFAKEVAGDFNPLHDVDAKRFCVPGDLLFAMVLFRYGLSERMCFTFSGMVGDGVPLAFPQSPGQRFQITNGDDKTYLEVDRQGQSTSDADLIAAFTRCYVSFSGSNFPNVLVPLLQKQGVMINPDRPLVIYENMSIQLDSLEMTTPELEPGQQHLEIQGKRGTVQLDFLVRDGGHVLGRGFKRLVVGGLKPYEATAAESLVAGYMAAKVAYSDR